MWGVKSSLGEGECPRKSVKSGEKVGWRLKPKEEGLRAVIDDKLLCLTKRVMH